GDGGEQCDSRRQLAERNERRQSGERPRNERDGECTVAHRDLRLEPDHCPERGRIVLVVCGRVTRERDARGEQQKPRGDQTDGYSEGEPAPEVEAEGSREQRDERKQVMLLEALRVRVGDLR